MTEKTTTLAALKERPHYSYSAMNTYLNICQLQYYYRYEERREAEQTPVALPFGSAFHAALSEQAQAARDGRLAEPDELTEAFAAYFTANIADSPNVILKEGDTIDSLIALASRMLSAANAEWPDFHQTIAEVAVPFSFEMDGLSKPVIGEYDLLIREPTPFDDAEAPTVTIVDWKTSARLWAEDRADRELQATIYIAAFQRTHGGRPDFRYDVVTKARQPKVARFHTTRSDEQIARMERLLVEADKAIRAGVFLPNETSFSCSDCPYAGACSKWHCGASAKSAA